MQSWPAIPAWLVGLSITVPPVDRSTLPGLKSQRRAFERRNDIMQAQLLLDTAEFDVFEAFVQGDLNQGADAFTGPIYDGAGYRNATLQLINGRYDPVWDGSFYTVSAQVMIYNRRDPDPDILALIYPTDFPYDDWLGMLQALEICVNNNNLDE